MRRAGRSAVRRACCVEAVEPEGDALQVPHWTFDLDSIDRRAAVILLRSAAIIFDGLVEAREDVRPEVVPGRPAGGLDPQLAAEHDD